MFRTSIVHLQERSYGVCCNLICPVVMRVKEELLAVLPSPSYKAEQSVRIAKLLST